MDSVTHKFPAQQLPYSRKGKKWRQQCVDFACDHTFLVSGANRKSVLHKQVNYRLLNGELDMKDVELLLNPFHIQDDLIPTKIQHYPIINSKLNILRGEEAKRVFDYKVIVTDPNSVSEAANAKKQELLQELQKLIENTSLSEEQMLQRLEEISQYYTYTWQDLREVRANRLLDYYNRKYNFAEIFNEGLVDAEAVGEEIYQCDIVSGEPILEKLDPKKVTVFRSSNSKRIEDADMIIIEDYWSPGKIYDHFYSDLDEQDRKYIEGLCESSVTGSDTDEMGNLHEKNGFVYVGDVRLTDQQVLNELFGEKNGLTTHSVYDFDGNIRVIRVYWKSRRKIKKVTSYDPKTGEEVVNFRTENYVLNTDLGEKEEVYWVNEAWEGTKIGENIYVNIRPKPAQYNTISNPSRCHFGIIGSLYTINDMEPYSMVDMMKPYNYLYDVVHDRLNRMLAKNYGKIIEMDMSLVPDGWEVDKWLYFIRKDGIAVKNSFNEGKGPFAGKPAGGLNNASRGVIDLDTGNTIQQYINILEFLKMEMSEVVGISKQREGQISNRETVGGVERATLQSSHITEWLFTIHDDVKRRAIECFAETAKIAMRGQNKIFPYIMPDFAQKMIEIDGDEFAESDYGLVVDNSQQTQELSQKLDGLIQVALQNQQMNFSTALKMYASCSLAEKMRMVENNEKEMQQRAQQAQEQEMQLKQQEIQARAQAEQQKLEMENAINERDNDTKLTIAMLQAENQETDEEPESNLSKEQLMEKMREFNLSFQLEKDKLASANANAEKDRAIKRQQLNKKPTQKK